MENEDLNCKSPNEALESISQLVEKNYRFVVPSYQRGYRWPKKMVGQLINDIVEFANNHEKLPKAEQETDYYCLQPLVLENRATADGNIYHVIDGQQRLTTISLILDMLEEKRNYTLSYERHGKGIELSKICEGNTVDAHFMKEACKVIAGKIKELKQFKESLLSCVKFIWHEISDQLASLPVSNSHQGVSDAANVFRRINIGKIPLTDSELIKAHLVRGRGNHSQNIYALEWDQIEYALQNKYLWYFINNKDEYTNRIEFIFDLLLNDGKKSQTHETYNNFVDNYVDKGNESIEGFWKAVKQYYHRIEEWYADIELYHLIGYLLKTNKSKPCEILKKSLTSNKDIFRTDIRAKVVQVASSYNPAKLEALSYGKHNQEIHSVLLLHNILTLAAMPGEKDPTAKNQSERFDFAWYAANSQSLEHIYPQSDNIIEVYKDTLESYCCGGNNTESIIEDFKSFKGEISALQQKENEKIATSPLVKDITRKIKGTYKFEDKKLCNALCAILHYCAIKLPSDHEPNLTSEPKYYKKLGALQSCINEYFGPPFDKVHGIGNIVLLEKGVNSSLGKKVFSKKRELIITKIQRGESIPVCTRNAFLKFYSKQSESNVKWGQSDYDAYFKDIEERLTNLHWLERKQ